jgi:maltooligosyltrehalose trehalohydrolase
MIRTDILKRTIGVNFIQNGGARISVWAPLRESVAVLLKNERIDLKKGSLGFWEGTTDLLKKGDKYKILLDDETEVPDPASLSQPDGVHGASQAIDVTDFTWSDGAFKNPQLEEYIFYELHTGAFTLDGTFKGIENKLDFLKNLGITAFEIMPVAQFPGERNWGYDGVFPFAVQNSYGGAEGLQHLVNACHERGLAVVLDVVYNHLGPEGNYIGEFGPVFTQKYRTPWGDAINFDDAYCDGVRKFFIENALMWFRDFHIDALRLDAVHAIKDFSATHILKEIKEHVDELMAQTGRTHHLIVELDLNDNRYINPFKAGGYGMDAQWIDEFHHALRVTSGQERTGYYSDFSGIEQLAKSFKSAYVFDGEYSEHRKKIFGVKAENPGKQFVVFSQNHDHVGNRMLGERTSTLLSFEMQKLMAAAVFISPFLPMIFMGEEYSESNPFLYFVSHEDEELKIAVRNGRKAEFAAFHAAGEAPDPFAEATFLQSKLQWDLTEKVPHATMLRYYKALIKLRKTHPVLKNPDRKNLEANADKEKNLLKITRWNTSEKVVCLLNFSKKIQTEIINENGKVFKRIFDSAAPEWGGNSLLKNDFSGGEIIDIQPESIVILSTDF